MKKIKILFVMVVLMFTLTGCENPQVFIENIVRSFKEDSVNKAVSEALSFNAPCDETTKAAQKNVDKVRQKENKAKSSWLYNNWDWYADQVDDKYIAKNQRATDRFNDALAGDGTYAKFLEAQKAQEEKDAKAATMAGFKKFIPIVLILLVLVAVILFLKKRPKRVKAPIPELQPSRKPLVDPNRTGAVAVNYEKLLRRNCEKLKLDYEKTLSQYNGDARAAVESTNLMII